MNIAYKITDIRALLDLFEKAGSDSVSFGGEHGREFAFIDWNSNPIRAAGVRGHDAPLDKSGRIDLN